MERRNLGVFRAKNIFDRPARIAFVLGAALYAGLVSVTKPFTFGANVLTALALLVVGIYAVITARTLHNQKSGQRFKVSYQSTWTPWICFLVLETAWELISLFGAPRSTHPTISSLYDAAARYEAVKAFIVFLWLAAGLALAVP